MAPRPSLWLPLLLLGAGAGNEQAAPLSQQERRDNANQEYQVGRVAFEKGAFLEAEPYFVKAAEWAPEFPEPHYALAQIYGRLGREQEAQLHMATAQRLMGKTAEAPSSEPR